MENSPFVPASGETEDSKESKTSTKKTKSAEAIGAIVVEPKNEKNNEKPVSIFDSLKNDKNNEIDEAEAPLESLSDEERHIVEAELVSNARENDVSEPFRDPEAIAAETAIASFHEKIVDQGGDSETAFAETIAEITAAANAQVESRKITTDPVIEAAPITSEMDLEEEVIDLRNEDASVTSEPIVLGGRTPIPTLESARTENEDSQDTNTVRGGYLVAGSTIAYLAGRRRGRIKTEKRFAAVEQKLKKQVIELKTELQRKETVIRKTAVEQVRQRPLEETTSQDVKAEQSAQQRTERKKAMPLERISKVVGAEALTLVNREFSAEPDRERAQEQVRNQVETKQPSPVKGLTEKDIVTLDRQELLTVSEKIIVEGTSLRRIYETHLVGEKGLRRLVAEFLRGGNMNKALKRELVEKEIDFERDPLVRDRNGGTGSDGGGTHLEKLLKKVDDLPGGDSGEMTLLKARAAHEAAEQNKRQRTRKTADMSLVGVIAVLIAAIIVLLIGR